MGANSSAFAVVDADSHVYEPQAIWDKYVAVEDRAAARAGLWHGFDDAGNRTTILNGRPAKELNRSKILRQAIWRPGTKPEDIGRLDPNVFHPPNPGAWDPEVRLRDMDVMGVQRAMLFPTIFAEYFPLVENPDVAAILARAYNDWICDFAQADPIRLVPAGILPMQSPLFARREIDYLARRGFKAVVLRPMFFAATVTEDRSLGARLEQLARNMNAGARPAPSRHEAEYRVHNTRGVFLDHRHFRPLLGQLEEAGMVACVHPSVGITNPEQTSEGSFVERVASRMRIGHSVAEVTAYLQDNGVFLTAACFHGLMEQFPRLRLALIHGGASFIPLVLEKSETYLWLSFTSFVNPVSLEPDKVFARHPTLVSFDGWESSVARMPDIFESKAAWGSRYPHHDASEAQAALEMLDQHGVSDATAARLMGRNAVEFFGLAAQE
jgi:predicted TIM-barrel fold metal-dependent hydrolase